MPTNLLVWNVQFFSSNKISMANASWHDFVDINGQIVDGTFTSLMNLDYILSNIKAVDAHIFVVIENLSSRGTHGSLAGGNGAVGSRLLLDRLRGQTLNQNWMLVPPLKTVNAVQVERGEDDLAALVREGAYTECVSVYYRNDLLDFIGPYVWPQTDNNDSPNKVAQSNSGQATQDYPGEWDGTYPAGNHYAGQFEYFRDPATRQEEILFPDIGGRRPFFTKFVERGGAQRTISLASVHYPPFREPAGTSFARTLSYFDEIYQMQNNEILLIAGDFNLDYLDRDNLATWVRLYNTAEIYGFQLVLKYPNVTWPTMLKRARDATPTSYTNNLGLDNIALRAQGVNVNYTYQIMDRVNVVAPSMMFTPMAEILQLPPQQRDQVFRLKQNFSYMGPVPGVSDHLAVSLQLN